MTTPPGLKPTVIPMSAPAGWLRNALLLALTASALELAEAQSIFATGKVSEILTGTQGLPFRMVEGPMWMEDTNSGAEGTSLRSGVIGDSGVTAFELPFVPGGQTIKWSVRTASEPNYDFLRFYLNGTEIGSAARSGDTGWSEISYFLPTVATGSPTDILLPTDTLSASSANSPAVDPVTHLLDNNPATIYRNYDKENVSITVTPQTGRAVVTGLRLTLRDYAPERGPATWQVHGSEDGQVFDLVAFGSVPSTTTSGSPTTGIPRPGSGSLLREVFSGITGPSLASLTNSPNYINGNATVSQLTSLVETGGNVADNYGQRIRGYFVPPVTGTYRFWIASDDNSVLMLSPDESSSNVREIASVADWTSSRQWTKFASQKSADIPLTANRAYYMEVLHKEGGGGDNLAVGWQPPAYNLLGPDDGFDSLTGGTSASIVAGASPVNESVTMAFDGNAQSKFLVYAASQMQVRITPKVRGSVVTALAMTTAGDEPSRDPIRYRIEGSNNGSNWETVATGDMSAVANRGLRRLFSFGNTRSFDAYRIYLDRVAGSSGGGHIQVAELELIEDSTMARTMPAAHFYPVGATLPSSTSTTTRHDLTFTNTKSYPIYRVRFPTLRSASTANSLQVADIGLIAVPTTHTLKWAYTKDNSVSTGLDAGWVDRIQLFYWPAILSQPEGGTCVPGATLRLAAQVRGGPGSTVAWYKDGSPTALSNGGRISGATTTELVIAAAAPGDSGSYVCRVSNPVGSADSRPAVIVVPVAPAITTQPVGGSINLNTALSLSVAATGTAPLSYIWRRDGVVLQGATGATYSVANVTTADSGNYSVTITNLAGAAQSTIVSVMVKAQPTITAQPVATLAAVTAQTVTLSVTATSSVQPVSYQWRKGATALVDGARIQGANAAVLTLSALELADAGSYTVEIANEVGTVTSTATALAVTPRNLAPSLDPLADVTLGEDAASTPVALSGITDGNGGGQALTITASSSNPSILPNPVVTYTSPAATGSLALVPAAGKSGVVVVTVRVLDNGGTTDGAPNSVERQFTVTVESRNDAPTLNALSAVGFLDAGLESGAGLTDSFSNNPPNGLLRGSASWVSENGGRIQLTPASVSRGLFFVPEFNPGRTVRGFTARFRMRIDQAGGTPADGLSFNFIPEDPSSVDIADPVKAEYGVGSGLSVGFVIWPTPVAVLRVGGQEVARSATFPIYEVGTSSDMPWAEVVFSPDRKVTVRFNGAVVLDAVQTSLDPGPGWRFGWGARGGGGFARHSIDDLSIHTFLERVRPRGNVLRPSDAITSLRGSSPNNQPVRNAIDGTTSDKWVIYGLDGMAFTVTPGVGPTLVNAFAITTGEDYPQRDPADFTLLGSNPGSGWEHIAAGPIPAYSQRLYRFVVEFSNSRPYSAYQIRFNRPQAFYDHMQVSEFELLGRTLTGVALSGIGDGDEGRQRLTVTATSGTPSVIGAPIVNYQTPQSTGSLVFMEPPAGANGTSAIQVKVQDDGGTTAGGIDVFERVFNVTVTPVNQPPTLATIDTVIVDTTSAVTVEVPLANISAGGDALSRTVAVTATSSTSAPKTLTLSPTVTYTSPETTGKVSFPIGQGVAGVATVRVTVTDQGGTANGGVNTFHRDFMVKAGPQPPVVETGPSSVVAVAGDTVVFTVRASGIGLNYQWSKDGTPISGATGTSLQLPFVTASSVGVYSVQVSNNNVDNQQPEPVRAFLGLVAPPIPTDVQSTQQAQFSSGLTLPAGFTAARQWLRDGMEIADATGGTYTIGTTTTGSVAAYSTRITVTPPSGWSSGPLVLTTPPAPLRLISDLTTVHSTGIATNGSRLADRSTDPHYTLIEPSPITGPAVAVVSSGSFPTPPWLAGGASSSWISPSARLRELGTAAGTEYIYRTTFNLNGIDLQTVRLAGKVAADDGVVRILLNGSPLTVPSGTTFDAFKEFDFRPGSTRFGDRFPERGFLGSGMHVAVTGDTTGATGDAAEPLPLGAGSHGAVGSIWWTWRAPSHSQVTVTTAGSAIPTVLSVFEGQALEALRHLGSTDGAGSAADTVRSLTFTAVAGRDYPIRVDGYQGAEGAVRIVVGALALDANGQPTGSLPTLVELAPGLLPRENTLDFVVRNTPDSGLDRSLTGLRVEFTAAQGVPRPVQLVAIPSGGVETYGNRKTFVTQVISGTPVTYEWYRDGKRIEGADEATLTFNRIEEEDAGTYTVRIQNLNGFVWTTPVPFEVDVPLTVTAQPSDQNVKVGAQARFGIRFRGNPPLTVQWYRNGQPIAGATDTNYTIASATVATAGRYHAVVADRDDFLASSEAVLNVLETPQMIQEPLDVAGISGVDTLRLTTIVDGSAPLRYLWFRNDIPLAVDDAPVLDLGILRPGHAGEYHLMATNPVGVVVSRKATVTVHEPPAVVSGSGNVKAFEGEKATFSVNATGSGSLEYSWYVGGTLVPSARGNTLDLDSLTRGQSGAVAVVVRSPYGSVTNDYTLEVFQPPVPVVSTGVNRTQQFTLKPGWNAIFLEVQPEQNDVSTVFKDVPFTSIWRWSDPRTGPQFVADQSEANLDVARWQIHIPTNRVESFQNNLAAVFRHEAYLVNVSGTADVTLTVTGSPGYQRSRWAVDSYTLTGLPIDPDWPGGGMTARGFFAPSGAHFDTATDQPRAIHRLQPNGTWVAVTSTDVLRAGEAYWIYTKGGSDYLAPIEAEIPGLTEVTYTLGADQKEIAFSFREYPEGNPIGSVFLSHWLPDQSLPLRINDSAPQEQSTWRDLPNGYSVSPRQGTRRTIRLGASRDRITVLRYEGILVLRGGGVRHVVPLVIERDKPEVVAEPSRPFNPVGLWMGVVNITHVSEVNGLKTNYVVRYDTNTLDGVQTVVSRATTEVRNVQQGSLPTPVKEPFGMRLLLHTGTDGVSQILQNVTILKRPDSATVVNQVVTAQQGGDGVLITDPTLLGSFEGATVRGRDRTGTRLSTPYYPMHQTNGIPFDAGLDLGRRIQASWSLPPASPLNPYRHKFHPDHDNLDRSFKTYTAEAYPVRRTVILDIPARQGSTRRPGAGQDDIEATYTEVIEGVHRIPITVQGTVTLRRVVAIGTLNPTP